MNLGRKPSNITQRRDLPRRKACCELLCIAQLGDLSVSMATVSAYFTCASEMLLQPQMKVNETTWSRKKTACKVGMRTSE
jgi:hypothetical protein